MMITKSYLRPSVIVRLISKTTRSNGLKNSQCVRNILKLCSIHLYVFLSRIADFDFPVPYVQHVCIMTCPYVIAHTRCCDYAPRMRYDQHSHNAHVVRRSKRPRFQLCNACIVFPVHSVPGHGGCGQSTIPPTCSCGASMRMHHVAYGDVVMALGAT